MAIFLPPPLFTFMSGYTAAACGSGAGSGVGSDRMIALCFTAENSWESGITAGNDDGGVCSWDAALFDVTDETT